jgi:hypothetical protein
MAWAVPNIPLGDAPRLYLRARHWRFSNFQRPATRWASGMPTFAWRSAETFSR